MHIYMLIQMKNSAYSDLLLNKATIKIKKYIIQNRN